MPRLIAGAASGLLVAATALGAGQLAAGLTGPLGSPVVAVGDAAISLTPVPVKEFAIAHFGSHDKDALVAGIFAVILVCAVLAGIAGMRRLPYGLAVLAAFAAAGIVAAVTRPQATAADVIPTLAGTAAACAALVVLIRAARAAFPRGPVPVPGESGEPAETAVAAAGPVLSTLVTAVKKAGLADTLNSAQGITVFAPDNAAFAKIPTATLGKVLASKTELTQILTYHVAAGRITPAELASGKVIKTLEGGTVTPAMSGGTYTVNGADVVCGNVQTANATVYIINTVLMPAKS